MKDIEDREVEEELADGLGINWFEEGGDIGLRRVGRRDEVGEVVEAGPKAEKIEA